MKRTVSLVGLMIAFFVAGCGDEENENSSASGDGSPASAKTPDPATSGPGPATPVPAPEVVPPDTVESLADQFMRQLDQVARAFQSVKDESSAKKMAEVIPLALAEFLSIASRMEKLPVPSQAVKERISAEMETREEEMAHALGGQEDFLNKLDPAIRPTVEKGMKEFNSTMESIGPMMTKYFSVENDTPPPPPPPDPLPVPVPETAPTPAPEPELSPETAPTPVPAPAPSDPETPAATE